MKLTFLLSCLLSTAALSQASEEYRILKSIPIAGDYGWDYMAVDEGSRRLYVSHDREVVVLDADSGAVVGLIQNTLGVHGIAIVPALKRGFITNGTPGTVTMFDTSTMKTIDEIKVDENPNCVLFDPKTGRIFTADRGSQRVSAIDPKTGKVVGTVENMGGKVEYAVADGKGHVFMNMQDKNTVVKIDAQNLKVMETWPLDPCREPTSIAMDRKSSRIFIGCRSGVTAVVDTIKGGLLTTLPIGSGVDATTYDIDRKLVFNSNGDGTLTITKQITPNKYQTVQTLKTQAGARTMAIDQKTHKLFLATAEYEPGPEPAPGQPRRRGRMIPGSFHVLVIGN